MKNICRLLSSLVLLLSAGTLFAFPDQEKATLSVASSQATSFIAQNDRFLFLGFASNVLRLDTQTFALSADQIPILSGEADVDGDADLGGNVQGLSISGNVLFITQSDGDLVRIDLNDVAKEDPPVDRISDGALGPIAADTDIQASDDQVYILSPSTNSVIVFDISEKTSISIPLVDGFGSPVLPEAIVFVPVTGSPDKVYVTSDRGLVFRIDEGGTSVAATINLTPVDTNKDLKAIAAGPDGDFVFVVDSTNSVVHVIDTSTDTEADTDSIASDVNPIELAQNSNLSSIVVTNVSRPDDIYGYVAGISGLSVIDFNLTLGGLTLTTVIDFNDTGGSDDEEDPLTLTSAPVTLVASSVSDGYVYSSNSNASLSVITDKPFVNITGTSTDGSSLTTGDSFNITFQTDVTGTFRVVVGGDSSGNGTEVGSGSVTTAFADVTTPDIAFDASLFSEGDNRVFVFVTDADGLEGRDATDVNVNSPPPGIEVLSTDFGDQKIFITFSRLTANDIDHYNLYIDTSEAAVAVKSDVAGILTQPGSGDTVKAKIVGLDNGVTYFVGLEAVDTSGNVGSRTTTFPDGSPISETPEQTVGLAEAVGESGCGLVRKEGRFDGRGMSVVGGCCLLILAVFRRRKPLFKKIGLFLLLSAFAHQPSTLSAEEYTPQWFSLEFKGGVWFPMNSTTKSSLGTLAPTGSIEFGFLYHGRYGAEIAVGVVSDSGTAFGATSGNPSGDRFDLLLVPVSNSFAFRADFKEDQLLVPYVKAGPDYVFFHESLNGKSTNGVKFGLHGAAGLQILLDGIDPLSNFMEREIGVNDVYFTVEGRYAWINNFGGGGLDLSNLTATGGFLFEF
ncbi:MAG TPA: hypothetical protein VFX30_09665 [bacterium]|nr:hypothetical protein [bacterium]